MSEHTDTRVRADPQEVAFRKIFIGGLSYSTDEEKLKKYFKQYGTVQDAVVMKDPVSKRSRGFGFITFVDIASVDNALANEPHTIDSRKVEAKRAVPRSEISRETTPTPKPSPASNSNANGPSASTSQKSSGPPANTSGKGPSAQGPPSQQSAPYEGKINLEDLAYNKIFVGGLHYDTRDAEFRSYFEKYGKVISAEVMFNRETHKSRGFGFIVFEVENSAVKVCNVKEHSIDGKVVEVKRAIPRSRLPAGTTTAAINAGLVKGPPPSAAMSHTTTAATNPSAKPASALPVPAPVQPAAAPLTKPRSVSGSGPSVTATGGRKPYSAVAGGLNDIRSAAPAPAPMPAAAPSASTAPKVSSVPSYAAALKGAAQPSATGSILPAHATSEHASASQLGDSPMTLQTLGYGRVGSPGIPRPSRSYSEPIVKFEGSSVLNNDSLPFDEKAKSTNPAGAITKTPSRSNSIAHAPANFLAYSPDGTPVNNATSGGNGGGNGSNTGTPVSLGNLPWLSSPPSNPLDPTGAEFGLPLPPASDQQKQSGLSSAESSQATGATAGPPPGYGGPMGAPPPGIMGNGQWFGAPPPHLGGDMLQQQAFHQQQAAQHQQYMNNGGPFPGMMYNPYMPGGPPPPGVAPSPDMWAAMVSSHAMHEQHQHGQGGLMQMPPQQFMMPPFPFFGPDGNPIHFPGATPQQQQMMFYTAQQQMHASMHQMQQLQYQNQAQAIALAQAQAQMAAMAQGQQGQPQGQGQGQQGDSSKALSGAAFGPGLGGYPPQGLQQQVPGAPQQGAKPSEHTENDDLFHFNELNLDSPVFDPSQAWVSANRR